MSTSIAVSAGQPNGRARAMKTNRHALRPAEEHRRTNSS